MSFYDFFQRMTGQQPPMSGQSNQPQAPFATMPQIQADDYRDAALGKMGQLGMLLVAAGQRMTPKERATILAQAPQYMDGVQRDAMTAAQARLMNMSTKAKQDEIEQQQALSQQAPALARKLGISPELISALSPEQIRDMYIKRQMADPRDSQLMDLKLQHEQAQIDALRNPRAATPQMVDLPGGGKGWATPGSTDVTPIGGAGKGTSEEPKKTEAEVKGYQFAQQSIDAYKKLADPEYQYALTSRAQQLANKLPYFSTPWSSNDYRSADAASSAMTDAILRNKSGATIHDPEIQDEIRRVIPQPGDTPEQLKDKVARQRLMIEGFIGAANPADRKALKELYDKTNNELMSKYTQSAPGNSANGASAPGVKSIRQIN